MNDKENYKEKSNNKSHETNLDENIDSNDDNKTDINNPKSEKNESDLEQKDFDNYKEKYIRLYAEFENFRKRTNSQTLSNIQNANKELIKKILPLVDDLERVLKSIENEGIKLILSKFHDILKKEGIEEIKINKGDDFDTDIAEAISIIETEKKYSSKIVDITEKGYKLNNKIIRFAKVVIGK